MLLIDVIDGATEKDGWVPMASSPFIFTTVQLDLSLVRSGVFAIGNKEILYCGRELQGNIALFHPGHAPIGIYAGTRPWCCIDVLTR